MSIAIKQSYSQAKTLDNLKCLHCSSIIETLVTNASGEKFCCKGCECVYHILKGGGLDLYYEMAVSENKEIPKSFDLYEYFYLKDDSYLDEYEDNGYYSFFVDGIECLACTWLFDNLSSLSSCIVDAQYFHHNNCFKIKVENKKQLLEALTPIIQLGYKISPVKDAVHLESFNSKKNKNDLIRIAVAMLLMGNISLFSFSDYFGLEGEFLNYFRHLSSLLFILVPTYCSLPFYKTSLRALKNRNISLDLPISFSIIVGTLLSYYHWRQGSGDLYFDSIATFVFLILTVRYVLNRIYLKVCESRNIDELLGARQVDININDEIVKRHSSLVVPGDIALINASTVSPLSGKIVKGASFFNESLLTGESDPVSKKTGDIITKGSYNYSTSVWIEVEQNKNDDLLQESLKSYESQNILFNNFSSLTQKYSFALVLIYGLAGVCLFSVLDFSVALDRFLALSIIGCPCALGIGIPLTCILTNQSLLKNGILIKDSNFFEKLRNVEHLFLDKTGTITSGDFDIEVHSGDIGYLPILLGIEKKSQHPIAKSIVARFNSEIDPACVEQFHEIIGQGASAQFQGSHYLAKAGEIEGTVDFLKDNHVVLTLVAEEKILDDEIHYLKELSSMYKVTILSGDNEAKVKHLVRKADEVNLSALGGLTPEEKREEVSSHHSLFIGDGLNDIPAMAKSGISISFNASDLVNLACQCVFMKPSLFLVRKLLSITQSVESIIWGNILFSIFYNLIGLTLACTGYVTPLFAVIFMPISSLAIIAMTFFRTRRL